MVEIGDEGHLSMHRRIGTTLARMRQDRPDWFIDACEDRFVDRYEQAGRFMLRHLAPGGLGHRIRLVDQFERVWKMTDDRADIGGMIPRPTASLTHLLKEPAARAITEAIVGRDAPVPGREAEFAAARAFYRDAGPSPTADAAPASEWMPFVGLHYLRGGWGPGESFVHMLSQPIGSPDTNGRNWNTEFRLWNDGVPLLEADPLTINGMEQLPTAGTPRLKPGSKAARMTEASGQPIPARWHTSDRFDLAETFYEGAYQAVSYDNAGAYMRYKQGPKVTPHARVERDLIQVRGANAFVVTDRVIVPRSESGPRSFSLVYDFWSTEQDPVEIDGRGDRLVRTAADGPGVALHHVGPRAVDFKADGKQESQRVKTDLMPDCLFTRRVTLKAEASDDWGLVTLVRPLAAGEDAGARVDDLSDRERIGFAADLPGGRLTWLTSRKAGEAAVMEAGPIRSKAVSLLIWEDAADPPGDASGIALGVEAFLPAPADRPADFEFVLRRGRAAEITPIRRPLAVPMIEPQQRVFTDSSEVSIACATPDAEVHYTVDGTAPTRDSPRYRGPFTIERSADVRARAFRPGATEVPWTSSGTDASPVAYATFERRAPKPAVAAADAGTGLAWDYFEDNWFRLFSHLGPNDVLTPRASGGPTEPFDVSMRATDGPFGVRYTGLLTVPATGVYSFFPPPGYVGAEGEPGYDLRVWIDGEEWDLPETRHARGRWDVPLERGAHRIVVTFADGRTLLPDGSRAMPDSGLWRSYPTPWVVWQEAVPTLGISGPGFERRPLPAAWLAPER